MLRAEQAVRYGFETEPGKEFELTVSAKGYVLIKPDGTRCVSKTLQLLYVLVQKWPDAVSLEELCSDDVPAPAKGVARGESTVLPALTRLKDEIGPRYYRRENGGFRFEFHVEKPGGSEPCGRAAEHILDFARRPNGAGFRDIVPILHTLSFARDPKTGLFMEAVDRSAAFEGEQRMNELTGWGDAQALQLLERLCRSGGASLPVRLGRPAASVLEAELNSLLSEQSVVWIGSPFQLTHAMVGVLQKEGYWEQSLRCRWHSRGKDGIRVEWPAGGRRSKKTDLIHTWGGQQRGKRAGEVRPRVEYALVARLQPRKAGGNLLICAGTDVMSTLEAAKMILDSRSEKIDWLWENRSPAGSFEALFKIMALNETIVTGPTRVWPDPEDDPE